MKTYKERPDEANELRNKYREALSTPLMSEGSISPYQVSMMSDRQKKKYQENAQLRLEIESQIRELEKSDVQVWESLYLSDLRDARGRISQLNTYIENLYRVGMGSRGKIRPTHQKAINKASEELNHIFEKFPHLKKEQQNGESE